MYLWARTAWGMHDLLWACGIGGPLLEAPSPDYDL